ncbi:MAG: class II aldolase/adducin family protein [Bacillota bacterium]
MLLKEERKKVITIAIKAQEDRLIPLTMGNFSLRDKETGYICITPSGMQYDELKTKDIVVIDIEGNIIEGVRKPSTELQLHLAAYRKRSDVYGVVHTHSTFATAWACCGEKIPVVVAEVATLLAGAVECAPYRLPGSAELARTTIEWLRDRNAVLMENHGVLAVGASIEVAYSNAVVTEEGAKIAFYAKQLGGMKIIPDEECKLLREITIKGYGQK